MQLSYLLLTLMVVSIWGLNFVFVAIGLDDFPPLFLVALRLFLTSVPALFFIKKPDLPFKKIIVYGLVMFALQFCFVFTGIYLGVSAGLTSVLQQTQLFFSLLFAFFFLQEKCTLWQALGATVSFAGVACIAMHIGGEVSVIGLILIVASAAAWGLGNIFSKKFGGINALSLIVWSCFTAWPMVLLASLTLEGPEKIIYGLQHISTTSISSILYITYMSTFVAYSAWSFLLTKLPLSTVAPFALLVPIVGMISSVLILNEPMPIWKISASLLVILGLALNLLGPVIFSGKIKAKIKFKLALKQS